LSHFKASFLNLILVICTYIFISKCFSAFAVSMLAHAIHVIILGVTFYTFCLFVYGAAAFQWARASSFTSFLHHILYVLHCIILMVFMYYREVFLKVGLVCIIDILEMLELTFLIYRHCWHTVAWLRHCATSRKVVGSIPSGVMGIFH